VIEIKDGGLVEVFTVWELFLVIIIIIIIVVVVVVVALSTRCTLTVEPGPIRGVRSELFALI